MEIMKNQEYCFCPDDGKRAMIFQCKKDAAEHIQKHLLSRPENEGWKIVLSTFDIPNTEDYVQELIRDGGITLNKKWKSEYDIVYSKMYATASSIVLTAISNAAKHQLFVKNNGITVSYSLFGVLCLIDEHGTPTLKTFFLPGLGKPADHQKQKTKRQGFSKLNKSRNRTTVSRSLEKELYDRVIKPGIQHIRTQNYKKEHIQNGNDYALLREKVKPLIKYDQWLTLYQQENTKVGQ